MFGEREHKSRVNTAEANSLNMKANICRDFGLQPLRFSRITVMEHGRVFSWQRQDGEDQRERAGGGGGWREAAQPTPRQGSDCRSLAPHPRPGLLLAADGARPAGEASSEVQQRNSHTEVWKDGLNGERTSGAGL